MTVTLHHDRESRWNLIVHPDAGLTSHATIKGAQRDQPDLAIADAEAILAKRGIAVKSWTETTPTCLHAVIA